MGRMPSDASVDGRHNHTTLSADPKTHISVGRRAHLLPCHSVAFAIPVPTPDPPAVLLTTRTRPACRTGLNATSTRTMDSSIGIYSPHTGVLFSALFVPALRNAGRTSPHYLPPTTSCPYLASHLHLHGFWVPRLLHRLGRNFTRFFGSSPPAVYVVRFGQLTCAPCQRRSGFASDIHSPAICYALTLRDGLTRAAQQSR